MTDPLHGADETPPPAIAPDGSPVLLYRRLPAGEEPSIIAGAVPPGASILELGCGAGRITHPLVRDGFRVTAVDESNAMLAWVHGAERVAAPIEGLALRHRFDAVVLASHLVNTPDDGRRARFLDTCRRHVADGGVVLLEHHPADWLATAAEGEREVGGVSVALREIRREPPFLSAVAVYTVEGKVFRQPFTVRVLTTEELAGVLRAAGLEPARSITPSWTAARPIAG
ncbi:MAG: class I SAM-dependent methyltransferase [Chloroflexota bacterium]